MEYSYSPSSDGVDQTPLSRGMLRDDEEGGDPEDSHASQSGFGSNGVLSFAWSEGDEPDRPGYFDFDLSGSHGVAEDDDRN